MSVRYERTGELTHVSELPKVVPAVLPKSLGAYEVLLEGM